MDPKLLKYYNRELQHLREVGAEFGREFPKIAGRLGLDQFECADPYVERLLEGFAFLAARVQLKIDAEFPAFTQHLLNVAYPHYLAPTPSMAVVEFQPDPNEGSLAEGFTVPRGTPLHSEIAKNEQTACEYRTAHAVTLFPLQLAEAHYLPNLAAVTALGIPPVPGTKAGLRLSLRTTAAVSFHELALDTLPLFLRGAGDLPFRLYEQLCSATTALAIQPGARPAAWTEVVRGRPLRRLGFGKTESLLPFGPRSFRGYGLLQEYFAFAERFLFVELTGLQGGIRRCGSTELDIVLLFERADPQLVHGVDAGNFGLFCTPAVNLFPKRADRLPIDLTATEHHIVPDRTRPMDFEVHSINAVTGYGSGPGSEIEFLPFYGFRGHQPHAGKPGLFSLRREKRLLSGKQRRQGTRSKYIGSEVFIALVDPAEAPFRGDLKQLGLETWCTNRDLPLVMPVGAGATDFTLQSGAPVQSIRCVAGPTEPRAYSADGETAWRLINHLSLNYLSLADTDSVAGAAALRELLTLYGDTRDSAVRKQIDGVLSVSTRNVVRRIDAKGPIVFGRGLEISVEFDEAAFEGTGYFLLGSVLEQFFSGYASINSFTETLIRTVNHRETMRWPVRIGQRHTL